MRNSNFLIGMACSWLLPAGKLSWLKAEEIELVDFSCFIKKLG